MEKLGRERLLDTDWRLMEVEPPAILELRL